MSKKEKIFDFSEFDKRFPSEKECQEYLHNALMAYEYQCPNCGCKEMRESTNYIIKCRKCGHKTSLTAQTDFFKHIHLPLRTRFKAIYYMCENKDKATAIELRKLLNIGSKDTSQEIVRDIKPMLYSIPDNLKLSENVVVGKWQIDFYGSKIDLCIAVEVHKRQLGKLVIAPFSEMEEFVNEYISENKKIKTEISYIIRVAKRFEKWCNREEKKDKKIEELMDFYSCNTFLYRNPNIDFDTVFKNILNKNTDNDYSCYYDKHIK